MEGWLGLTWLGCPDMVEEPGPGALGSLGSGGAGISEEGPEEVWVEVEDGTMFILAQSLMQS